MGSKTALFSLKFEEELVKHVKEMESAMHCLTMIDLRRLAFDLAVRANIAHSFTNGRSGLGEGIPWQAQHSHHQAAHCDELGSNQRIQQGCGGEFFWELQSFTYGRYTFVTTRIWNCDETRFTTVAKPSKVICTTGINHVRKVSSAERGKNITALCCMNAAGMFVPPTIRVSTEANDRVTNEWVSG